MPPTRIAGFRLGIYVFKDAEIVDFVAPYGVFSVARRYDPEADLSALLDGTLKQQRLLVNCPRAVGAEELRQLIQSSFEYW